MIIWWDSDPWSGWPDWGGFSGAGGGGPTVINTNWPRYLRRKNRR